MTQTQTLRDVQTYIDMSSVPLKMMSAIRMNNAFLYFVITCRTLINNRVTDTGATNDPVWELKVHVLV